MKTYKYPFLARLFYRYANIPATVLLFIHLVSSLLLISEQWYFVLPALINGLVIYVLNRFYYKIYKYFPFNISIDNEKIICTDFMFSNRTVEIKLSDIDTIKGGIFSGHATRPIYLHDGNNDITIGVYQHLKNFNQFSTTVLSNINKKLYNELLDNMKEIGEIRKGIRKKKARK